MSFPGDGAMTLLPSVSDAGRFDLNRALTPEVSDTRRALFRLVAPASRIGQKGTMSSRWQRV